MTDPEDPWASIDSLQGLGNATAAWLRGEIEYHPTNNGPPDGETSEITSHLAALNEMGYVTDFSQPGGADEQVVLRASVSGWCTIEVADWMIRTCWPTELIALAFGPGADHDPWVPITLAEGEPYTWARGRPGDEHVEEVFSGCTPALAAEVTAAWHVAVLDPVWGRNDLLWSTLVHALAHPPEPWMGPPGIYEGSGQEPTEQWWSHLD